MRKETSSLAFGSDGFFGSGSGGFVVAALNAASAVCHGSLGRRVLSPVISTPVPRALIAYNVGEPLMLHTFYFFMA